jgi:ElaB/YqjD/DUF883 family membrane-anchored ribosome-binding protein
MKPKEQKRLAQIIKSLDEGAVQPEDLMAALDAVMEVINNLEARLAAVIADHKDEASNTASSLSGDMQRARAELESLIEQAKNVATEEAGSIAAQIRQELSAVSSRIPQMPNMTDVWTRIAEVEALIPTLPAEKLGEDYRNALEALPEGEKLAIEAIEGLRKELDSLKKTMQRGGGGGTQGGITAAHPPLHETFTMNGSDTTVTLSQGVGAQGNAIFALRYQGQVLDMTTHYTVNGNKITFVGFTPEASSIISVTYLS